MCQNLPIKITRTVQKTQHELSMSHQETTVAKTNQLSLCRHFHKYLDCFYVCVHLPLTPGMACCWSGDC